MPCAPMTHLLFERIDNTLLSNLDAPTVVQAARKKRKNTAKLKSQRRTPKGIAFASETPPHGRSHQQDRVACSCHSRFQCVLSIARDTPETILDEPPACRSCCRPTWASVERRGKLPKKTVKVSGGRFLGSSLFDLEVNLRHPRLWNEQPTMYLLNVGTAISRMTALPAWVRRRVRRPSLEWV